MSWQSRLRRKGIIFALREEGYHAGLTGASHASNPHKHDDALQWSNGWRRGHDEMIEAAKVRMDAQQKFLDSCIDEYKVWPGAGLL